MVVAISQDELLMNQNKINDVLMSLEYCYEVASRLSVVAPRCIVVQLIWNHGNPWMHRTSVPPYMDIVDG